MKTKKLRSCFFFGQFTITKAIFYIIHFPFQLDHVKYETYFNAKHNHFINGFSCQDQSTLSLCNIKISLVLVNIGYLFKTFKTLQKPKKSVVLKKKLHLELNIWSDVRI